MPAIRTVELRGFEFHIAPKKRWKRLWGPWRSFYVENVNPDFHLLIKRVKEESPDDPWPDGNIYVRVNFSDGQGRTSEPIPVPSLEVGQHTIGEIKEVFVPVPGNTRIGLVDPPVAGGRWWAL